jgi:hypothetical protein
MFYVHHQDRRIGQARSQREKRGRDSDQLCQNFRLFMKKEGKGRQQASIISFDLLYSGFLFGIFFDP